MLRFVRTLTVACVVLFAGIPTATASSIVLNPGPAAGMDAEINTQVPNQNLGSDPHLIINWVGNSRSIGLIEFDLSAITPGTTVADATLSLFHEFNAQVNARYDAFRVTSAWNEATVTFNTGPTINPTAVSSLTFTGAPGVYRDWDVTTVVQGWVNGAFPNFGLWIEEIPVQGSSSAYFESSDSADPARRPILTITTADQVTVPEPTSLVLLGSGVAMLYARRRRARI